MWRGGEGVKRETYGNHKSANGVVKVAIAESQNRKLQEAIQIPIERNCKRPSNRCVVVGVSTYHNLYTSLPEVVGPTFATQERSGQPFNRRQLRATK